MSIAGGVHRAIERARSIECTRDADFREKQHAVVRAAVDPRGDQSVSRSSERQRLAAVFAHANYLINLAATNPQFHANSLRALSEELTRADQLGLPFIVLHPGAHLGAGEEAGLEKVVTVNRSDLRRNSKGEDADRARDDRGPGLVPRSHLRASRPHHRAACASRSGSASASTPRTFSRPVTT